MICSRCLKRSTFSRLQSQSRAFTSTPSSPPPLQLPHLALLEPPVHQQQHPPASLNLFLHPFPFPPAALGIFSQPAKKTAPLPTSSVPAGTILRGLNFLKGRDDPKAVDGAEATGGDEFSKSKKLRRQAAKARRKAEERALLSGDTRKEALEQRADLRKAMRKERRAKIKEGNYLKGIDSTQVYEGYGVGVCCERSWYGMLCIELSGTRFDTRIYTYKGGSWSLEGKPSRKRELCITFVYMHIVRMLETKSVLYDSLKTSIMLSTRMGIIEQRRQLHSSPWNFPSLRMHQCNTTQLQSQTLPVSCHASPSIPSVPIPTPHAKPSKYRQPVLNIVVESTQNLSKLLSLQVPKLLSS
ncbi:hypothetical protein DID88_006357 [Monilinia fructigena]|uniref:Uncharacterized protein n=1 Tax=Monilinia fructigena TaxID=38457 RepID=A0A395J2F5_9HELO|nr:hypothetical protein DID88_006357 [Monilinia fructigena]